MSPPMRSNLFDDVDPANCETDIVACGKHDSAEFPLCKGLPRAHFDIIYADPPFEYTRKVGSGVANNHYGVMTDTQLMAMGEEINLITTKDSALFMWCSGPTFNRALKLITAWGFTYKTIAFNWIKTAAHDATKPCMMGLGSYSRLGSEFVLVPKSWLALRTSRSAWLTCTSVPGLIAFIVRAIGDSVQLARHSYFIHYGHKQVSSKQPNNICSSHADNVHTQKYNHRRSDCDEMPSHILCL
jgi:hypothetical protein